MTIKWNHIHLLFTVFCQIWLTPCLDYSIMLYIWQDLWPQNGNLQQKVDAHLLWSDAQTRQLSIAQNSNPSQKNVPNMIDIIFGLLHNMLLMLVPVYAFPCENMRFACEVTAYKMESKLNREQKISFAILAKLESSNLCSMHYLQ